MALFRVRRSDSSQMFEKGSLPVQIWFTKSVKGMNMKSTKRDYIPIRDILLQQYSTHKLTCQPPSSLAKKRNPKHGFKKKMAGKRNVEDR